MRFIIVLLLSLVTNCTLASTGKWASQVTGGNIAFRGTEAKKTVRDAAGNVLTVVYMEGLAGHKLGRNKNNVDVAWLLSQGYRVIELNYDGDRRTVSPAINVDIAAINRELARGDFCGFRNCSKLQSYVLFEGYRLKRNVAYYLDDPKVYNTPADYVRGDSLYMDIIYPANTKKRVPVILSFSYSNSFAGQQHQRMKLDYTLAAFNDTFLEGAPAKGFAWAIADHPKYCQWGKGQPVGGKTDTYKSYETNPDAARKVRSAVRALRGVGKGLGLSGNIGIFGFSRGATAGSMAVGDKRVKEIDTAGLYCGVSSSVQAAALGPGVFDYTQIYNFIGDGDQALETRCPWAWGSLQQNAQLWQSMGAVYLVESKKAAPVLFFYNSDDEHYYHDQVKLFKARLDALKVPTAILTDYGHGHAVPQTPAALSQMYNFFRRYL